MLDLKPCIGLLGCLVAVVAVSTATACATWGDPQPGGETSLQQQTAVVQNNAAHEVVVLVSGGGIEWRLGTVRPATESTFVLPGKITTLDRYYLVTDPVGAQAPAASRALRPSQVPRPHVVIRRGHLDLTCPPPSRPRRHGGRPELAP